MQVGEGACPRVIVGGWQLSAGHRAGFDADRAIEGMLQMVHLGLAAFDMGDIYTGVRHLLFRLYSSLVPITCLFLLPLVPYMPVTPPLVEKKLQHGPLGGVSCGQGCLG